MAGFLIDGGQTFHYDLYMASERLKAEEIIGKSIDDFISRKKRSGSSWREIGSDLFIATGGVIDVSVATLKHWSNTPKRQLTPE